MMTTDQRAELDAVMAKALKTRDACRYYSMSVSFKNTPEAEAMLNLAMWAAPLLTATIDAQAAEIARLREALQFYADKDVWNQPPVKTVESILGIAYENKASQMQKDRGKLARAALAPNGAA